MSPSRSPSGSPARRKVVYLSGTRADFGLMQSTLLQLHRVVDLSIAVTGMHLDAEFGNTALEIEATGLRICGRIVLDMQTRSPQGMSLALADCLHGVTQLLAQEKPDILLLLGDRGEVLAGALAALHLGIITVHIHGGERSGTVDESIRHAISKLCTYHCVATVESRERLVRMGELPDHITVTGAPGLDGLVARAQMSAFECRRRLGLPAVEPFVLALFHPVVQQAEEAYAQTLVLLEALADTHLPVIWLDPNADAGSQGILQALSVQPLPRNSQRLRHLPRSLFCAALRYASVLVGNSSAGIIEAASFGTPVINIGQRQRLRERNANVLDVDVNTPAIIAALHSTLAQGAYAPTNIYGDGQAGERIVQVVLHASLDGRWLEKANAY